MLSALNIIGLKLRSKLILVFLLVGMITSGAIGYLGYSSAREGLEKESFNKLRSVREIKKNQIESYFQQIENQVVTFSENRMIIDAMKAFKKNFHEIDQELGLSETSASAKDAKVREYYQKEYLTRLTPNLGQKVSVADYWPEDKNTRILQDLGNVLNLLILI